MIADIGRSEVPEEQMIPRAILEIAASSCKAYVNSSREFILL